MTDAEFVASRMSKLFATYNLWNSWTFDTNSDGEHTLAIDEPKETVLYIGVKRLYRNKGVCAAIWKQPDGVEQVILLDPDLEVE